MMNSITWIFSIFRSYPSTRYAPSGRTASIQLTTKISQFVSISSMQTKKTSRFANAHSKRTESRDIHLRSPRRRPQADSRGANVRIPLLASLWIRRGFQPCSPPAFDFSRPILSECQRVEEDERLSQLKNIFLTSIIAIILFCFSRHSHAQIPSHNTLQEKMSTPLSPEKKKPSRRVRHPKKLISFNFENEDLVDIINFLASEKEVNVVLPMGANIINAKVTLHLEEKITVDEAWDILYTLLDLAGYSMIAKEDTYNIVKTTKDVYREPLPLYIVKPEEIPNTDKRIRYLYYFSNIKVVDADTATPGVQNEMYDLVQQVLPADTAISRLDSQTNSLILSDKANNIKALMNIIVALDQTEAQEKPEIIQLRYLNADVVASLFNEQLLKTAGDANQARLGIRQQNNGTFFKRVRIIPDIRTNRLIVFGRPQAIERVRDFIHKYIDVELESGKSILHVYQLQYLDAKPFALILEKIVKSERTGGTEQSRTAAGQGGAERFFSEVIIRADQADTISGEQPGDTPRGSNNLIIAARSDDYERIKKLIEELDIPQPQVIIEVLIADLTIQDMASLGASVRNPLGLGLPSNVNFQSAQATNFILTNTVVSPVTLQSDLLRKAFNQGGRIVADPCDNPTPSECFSAARFITGNPGQEGLPGGNLGTTLFSFNDPATGQTWGIAQVQKLLDAKKVLSHPHLITTNNRQAEIVIQEERLARDQGSGSTGGTTTQTRKWIPAALSVKITPRISSADMVNLRVEVNINQFTTPSSSFSNVGVDSANTANQITRNVTTNANVRNGNILALGGLTRVDTTIEQLETPLLGKIPIIGWLFKDRTNTINKNNLTVFISPTIIMPRLRGGVGEYTKNHVHLAKSYSQEAMLFDNLRDPITRWFFRTQRDDADTTLNDFLAQDEFIAPTLFDVRKENNRIADNKKNASEENKQPTVVAQAQKPANSQPEASTDKIMDLKTMLADTENPFKKIG